MYVCKIWLIKPWSSKTRASSDLIMKAEINCEHATEFPNRSFIRSKFQTEFLSLAWFPHTDHAIKITMAIIVRLQWLPSSVVNNWNNYQTNTHIKNRTSIERYFRKCPKAIYSDTVGTLSKNIASQVLVKIFTLPWAMNIGRALTWIY